MSLQEKQLSVIRGDKSIKPRVYVSENRVVLSFNRNDGATISFSMNSDDDGLSIRDQFIVDMIRVDRITRVETISPETGEIWETVNYDGNFFKTLWNFIHGEKL